MARHDASTAEVFVLSFKDGMLAKLAHDLKMKVGSFTLDIDDTTKQIDAKFDARSVKVVCRRKDGHDESGGLSSFEVGQIDGNIQNDVLETKKHTDIRFVSTAIEPKGDGYTVRGDLTLHGKTRSVSADVKKQGDRYVTELKLHQPDFGIKPYSAALGALKVQADVIVQVSVPV
jgi:hypothetical protein